MQYVFQTCVNKANERTLHDELAKQLALYLKQQDSDSISLLLDVSRGGGVGTHRFSFRKVVVLQVPASDCQ